MKFKPFSLYSEDTAVHGFMKATDFSDKAYDGVEMRCTDKGLPVVIMHSKETAPLMWKVVYGFSQVYFRSFAEAVDFCNSRGMKIMKEQVNR